MLPVEQTASQQTTPRCRRPATSRLQKQLCRKPKGAQKPAKYQITYSCGHEDTLKAFGPEKGRKIVLEWAEKYGLCHKCYKEQQETELFDFETEHCLPNIKDTAKETAWARRLRKNMLTETFEYTWKTKGHPEIDAFIEWLKGQTDCKFWINNDSKPVKELFTIFREEKNKEDSL